MRVGSWELSRRAVAHLCVRGLDVSRAVIDIGKTGGSSVRDSHGGCRSVWREIFTGESLATSHHMSSHVGTSATG